MLFLQVVDIFLKFGLRTGAAFSVTGNRFLCKIVMANEKWWLYAGMEQKKGY